MVLGNSNLCLTFHDFCVIFTQNLNIMPQDTATAVATKLYSICVSSEGKFDNGDGLPINERFRIQIAHDPEAKEEYRGSYTIEGAKEFSGPVTHIEMFKRDAYVSFQLLGPLLEKRTCTLRAAPSPDQGLSSGLVGELKGDYFDPLSGSLKKMTGKCTVATVTVEEGRIVEKEISLKGISSYEDAQALARISGLGVKLIMQAFLIPHPEDEALMAKIEARQLTKEELMRTALFGGKGPLPADMAVRVICDDFLSCNVTRTEYTLVKDEE